MSIKRFNRLGRIALLLVLVSFLAGCAEMGPTRSYLAIHKSFNDVVEDYKIYYQASPPEEQARLNKEVTPLVQEALQLSIDINKIIEEGGEVSLAESQRFRELRYELYLKLPEIFKKGG